MKHDVPELMCNDRKLQCSNSLSYVYNPFTMTMRWT